MMFVVAQTHAEDPQQVQTQLFRDRFDRCLVAALDEAEEFL
jgi:hypothetical protein